jgi:hypothetical protein
VDAVITSALTHFISKLLLLLIFFSHDRSLILFKILIQICKTISHDSIFFSDKINHNKIYYNFKN